MGQGYSNLLVVQQGDGPTLTTAAAASCIATGARTTLPAQFWDRPGKSVRITAHGRISSVITTPGTARFDVRIGGVIAWDSLAILLDSVAGHTNVPWWLEIDLTCRAIGSGTATNLIGNGRWFCEDILGTPATAPKGSLQAMLPWNAAPVVGTGFDNTVNNTLDMFFTQTAGTGSLIVHQYKVYEEN